jgi:hypothetical protein
MESYDFDLYEVLDLGPDAHEAEIKKAYRQLALLHHPDRTGGNETTRFLQIKTAYDVLIDRDKRTNYDAFHSDRRFARDRRPLTAKEAAWLVDAQKRAWGVREVQPFAVCILCDSCPCPADGVCYACGMHFCQMCVRKMHCRDGIAPHYPVRRAATPARTLTLTLTLILALALTLTLTLALTLILALALTLTLTLTLTRCARAATSARSSRSR